MFTKMQETKFRFNPIELGHLPTATAGGTHRGCPEERAALRTAGAEGLRGCLGERAALHIATAEWLRGWARAGRRGLHHRTTTPGLWWQPFPTSTGRAEDRKTSK